MVESNHSWTEHVRSPRWLAFLSFGTLVFTAALLSGSGKALFKLIFLVPTLSLGWLIFWGRLLWSSRIAKRRILILLSAFPMVGLYILGLLRDPSRQAFENVSQLVLVWGFLIGISSIYWSVHAVIVLGRVASIFLASQFVLWVIEGMPWLFSGPMMHPNGLGLFTYLVSFYPLAMWLTGMRRADQTFGIASMVLVLVLLVVSSSRASLMALLVTFVVYVVLTVIIRTKWMFHAFYFLTLGVVFMVTFLYVGAAQYDWAWVLNSLSVEYTGKNLFSGREYLWLVLIEVIKAKPWFGYGPGTMASDFTGLDFSAHNLYFQIVLQIGFIGLAAFFVFLWFIWDAFWKGKSDLYVRLSAAYMIGMLFHQIFEVSLIQNNLASGFLSWIIIGIGVSRALLLKRQVCLWNKSDGAWSIKPCVVKRKKEWG